MIRINQIKLPIPHTKEALEQKIRKALHLKQEQAFTYEIIRQSVDARKKSEKKFVYSVNISIPGESKILRKVVDKNVMSAKAQEYHFPSGGESELKERPVIVGSGPAGLFCAYMLASHGYRPIVLERGADVRERLKTVEDFWKTGRLNTQSNVQFGEGGAGTFSDGKLNTLVKDPDGRGREALRIFTECGAPEEILYQQKPHLGTDVLVDIVACMRKKIEAWGGEFRFWNQVTDLKIQSDSVTGVVINEEQELAAQVLVLAIGHSARDTFEMLYSRQIAMRQKSFAVGVRIEHPQKMINLALYGEESNPHLGAAPYKLTAQTSNGRGAYTFCMCPGGYVVNASSEEQMLAVNGMSYQKRDSANANSAVIVTVTPEDFPSDHPLSGVEFQRRLENAAYKAAGGDVPVQLFQDFCDNRKSLQLGEVTPCIKGNWQFANLREILPDYICSSLEDAIGDFGHKIPGFSRGDAVLSGVESRTSSPVRIERDASMQSSLSGVYPCGEGAGYAGGITSAAMDGIKVAEAIAGKYRPLRPIVLL